MFNEAQDAVLECLVLWKEIRKYSHLMSFNLGILFCFIKLIAQNNQTVIKIVRDSFIHCCRAELFYRTRRVFSHGKGLKKTELSMVYIHIN